jgi:polar amino acid transport system substrate-binding protein
MRRFVAITAAIAIGAAALAAAGVARSERPDAQAPAAKPKPAKLPALPAEVKARKRWLIGVKCDFPPFGYINVRGQNAGYDVEIARRFAELAFFSKKKVSLTCVTTPSRIPTLQDKRVDIIISTLTWTAAREEVIDYSIPYYSATGRLLVPNASTMRLSDLNGKSIVTTRGSIYDRWVKNCFPRATLNVVDSPVAATQVLKDGRADTFMFDDAFLLGVATQDRTLKLTPDKFLEIPWGIGIRKNEPAMARWVNAALTRMKKRDEFAGILKRNSPAFLYRQFVENVPRPKNSFRYPRGTVPESVCP